MWKRSIGPLRKRVSGRGLELVLKKKVLEEVWERVTLIPLNAFSPSSFQAPLGHSELNIERREDHLHINYVALPATWHEESESNDLNFHQGKYCVLEASLLSSILMVLKTDTQFHYTLISSIKVALRNRDKYTIKHFCANSNI